MTINRDSTSAQGLMRTFHYPSIPASAVAMIFTMATALTSAQNNAKVGLTAIADIKSATNAALRKIVVTATKRGPANVPDVPAPISAFGAEQLEALNFRDLSSPSTV